MFKCAMGHTTKPGDKMTKVVTKRRDRIYTNKAEDGAKISRGWEIVTEAPFCSDHTPTAGVIRL